MTRIEAQSSFVAEAVILSQHEPVPENAVFDVEWVKAEIAKLDRAFDAASAYTFEGPDADVVESKLPGPRPRPRPRSPSRLTSPTGMKTPTCRS